MKKNFINPYLVNMYMAGLVIRKEEDNMGTLKTINNDYIIKVNREDARLWYTDTSFKYICKFSFINDLNINVFSFQVNENDIYILLDNIYQYMEYNLSNIITMLGNCTIEFKRNNKVYNNSFMCIYESNIPRITIEFDEDNLLEFVDLIYFCFLIDIDCIKYNDKIRNELL